MAPEKKSWVSRVVSRALYLHRKPRKKKKKSQTNLHKVIDYLMVPAVHSGEACSVEQVFDRLDHEDIGRLGKATIMGSARLLIQSGRLKTVERLIATYVSQPRRESLLLYFLEPLVELDRAGALTEAALLEFCAQFRPPSSALALDWLSKEYKPADEADQRNFERLVVTPLRALSERPGNLMDIRFSAKQRAALQAKIMSALAEERPLSLLRLGDGEGYPFPAPDLDGIDPSISLSDDRNFECKELHWGVSPPPRNSREELIKDFRQAVARCDILGCPSVYRIVRNLRPHPSRYGTHRNQRAFIRILGSLGNDIPVSEKTFTEERCTRIRGAIDEPFILDLAAKARSVVLVSSWPEIQSKFPVKSSFIKVPAGGTRSELFKIYPDIVERICGLARPGTLVLIGAGVPAKIMADQARQSGAVALDVGSLMDYVVGHKTRTIADLI